MIPKPPYEKDEQMAVAGWLDAIGVVWLHIPNERMVNHLNNKGARMGYLNSLARQGLKKGALDNFIFTPAPGNGKPTAFELKRIGEKATADQKEWIAKLYALGWNTGCFQGFDMTYAWLRGLGYGVRP
jgi:hypothetical protein